jgi:hypothetical protein
MHGLEIALKQWYTTQGIGRVGAFQRLCWTRVRLSWFTKIGCTSIERATSVGYVPWKAGDYIRVWDRVNGSHSRCSGFCFNSASGQIGKFSTVSPYLELVD